MVTCRVLQKIPSSLEGVDPADLAALERIGSWLLSELDLDTLVQRLADEMTALCGAEFGAFFYSFSNGGARRYALAGAPSARFDSFAAPRDTGLFGRTFRGEVVRSDDITQDARYGQNPPHRGLPEGHLPVRSYLAVPVTSPRSGVVGGLFFGHAQPSRFGARHEELVRAMAARAAIAFDNARFYAEAQAARLEAEASQRRFRFLAAASAALSESLDFETTLRRVARCAVPEIADWCTVAVREERGGRLRRVAAVHRDPALREEIARYERSFPPEEHRSGSLPAVAAGRSVLYRRIEDADLCAAAQSPEHLELMRTLGCRSCMMVPIFRRGKTMGVLSFMIADAARAFCEADLAMAEDLAYRVGLAIENALLYREAQRREESMAFFAEASAILGSSLDYNLTMQSLARLVVPRFADWCSVEICEEGRIRNLAVAHLDPSKVELARELQRRWPIRVQGPLGVASVLRTGKSECYPEISDELLAQLAHDPDHLRVTRELGLRSALIVPLSARGHTLGTLSLIWAESDRRYSDAEVRLMEELGRRAGTAIDHARLFDEAQRAVRMRDEFLSIASHELKTPLTSLRLHVSGIQRHARRGRFDLLVPERLAPKIDAIDTQVERLSTLINSLLDVGRASGGQLKLELAEVELTELVRQVVGRLGADLRNAGCEVRLELQGPLTGHWDRLRLEQVVTNFLSNALKYGPGMPIEISALRRGDQALLSVRDYGIGIAAADQSRIFERFARAVSVEHFGGFGLGLWIVRVFVSAMGGAVRVQSTPGAGATFFVELPLSGPAEEAPAGSIYE